ncbi:Hypothetical protein SRAE_X000098000 [Strongyloides ratti]|uniref:Uncharacterized protein n=1 Tax=Strongyloides ratti TaxID=34506 RepID=A0A090LTW3_STRRB|nr:Hypothetical protein SRAE_X000098000 [Strongyloides ratti]CEF71657.1 Hypothetical protein SRAE_X000098000 [Strongyloides ratti]
MSCKVQPIYLNDELNKRNEYIILPVQEYENENEKTSFQWNIFKFFKNRKNPHTENGEEFKSPLSVHTRILILIFGFSFLSFIFYIEYSQAPRYRSY